MDRDIKQLLNRISQIQEAMSNLTDESDVEASHSNADDLMVSLAETLVLLNGDGELKMVIDDIIETYNSLEKFCA